jgi:hypothetical protein
LKSEKQARCVIIFCRGPMVKPKILPLIDLQNDYFPGGKFPLWNKVCILPDCCTTVGEMIHNIALHAVSPRVPLVNSHEAI